MIERLADRAVAVRADHQLVAGAKRQRAEHGGYAFGHVAHPRRAGRVDAEERGRALPRRRNQPGNLDAIEPVRIAFRALAPRRGGLPDGDRRDTERTVIEVEDVGIEAEGLQECSVHEPILPSRATIPSVHPVLHAAR